MPATPIGQFKDGLMHNYYVPLNKNHQKYGTPQTQITSYLLNPPNKYRKKHLFGSNATQQKHLKRCLVASFS